jgi:hypothetical protein
MPWRADKTRRNCPPRRCGGRQPTGAFGGGSQALLFGASFRALGSYIGDQLVQIISMRLIDRRIEITLEYSFSNISIARNRLLLGFMRGNDLKELFVYGARVDLRFSQSVLARAS